MPVELYKKYLSQVSNEVRNNAFYLRTLPNPNGEIWLYKKAAGRETSGNVVKKIIKKAQFDGHYTNHCLNTTSRRFKVAEHSLPALCRFC